MEVTVKKIDGKLVALVPVEDLTDIDVSEGDRLVLGATDAGPTLTSLDASSDMELVDQIMGEDDEVLRKLAQ